MSEAEHIKEIMDAREAAIQARLDQHVAVRLIPLEINLENLRELMNQRFAAVHERFSGLDRRLADLTAEVRELGRRLDSFKVTMMVAVVATGLSTVLGVAAFNAALLSNMQESYKSGQGAGALQAETNRLLTDMRKDMSALDRKVDGMAKDQAEFRAQTQSQFKEVQQEFKEVRHEIGRLQRPANLAPSVRKPPAAAPRP